MAETGPSANKDLKRPASPHDPATLDDRSTKGSEDHLDDPDQAARDEIIEAINRAYAKLPASLPPRDECNDIIDDLEAGTHVLIFEHNTTQHTRCRAKDCQVEALPHYDRTIKGPYRIKLQELKPDNESWSQQRAHRARGFFHITCIEAIGLDLTHYLQLTPAGIYDAGPFHPAIKHWIKFKGKTYDSDKYANIDFDEACDFYECRFQDRAARVIHGLSGPIRKLRAPRITDFVSDDEKKEMVDRSLSEVILDTMGGLHLATFSPGMYSPSLRVEALEIWDDVLEPYSLEAHEARIAGTASDEESAGETGYDTQSPDAGQPAGEAKSETDSAIGQTQLVIDEGTEVLHEQLGSG